MKLVEFCGWSGGEKRGFGVRNVGFCWKIIKVFGGKVRIYWKIIMILQDIHDFYIICAGVLRTAGAWT